MSSSGLIAIKAITTSRLKRFVVKCVLRLNSWLSSHNGAKPLFSEDIPVPIRLKAPKGQQTLKKKDYPWYLGTATKAIQKRRGNPKAVPFGTANIC